MRRRTIVLAKKQRKPQFVTPAGIAVYPWLNKPDTKKFESGNNKPQYKVKLKLTPQEFEKSLKGLIDEAAERGLVEAIAEKKTRKKTFSLYVPYEDELDDEGDETGNILVKFSQNAQIRRKDGEVIDIVIPLFDKTGEATDVLVFGGSLIKVAFTMRTFANDATKQAGVTLDIAAAQVLKAVKTARTADAFGFQAEEDDAEYEEAPEDEGDDLDDEIPF